jgi:hypothetical protein
MAANTRRLRGPRFRIVFGLAVVGERDRGVRLTMRQDEITVVRWLGRTKDVDRLAMELRLEADEGSGIATEISVEEPPRRKNVSEPRRAGGRDVQRLVGGD